jgi:NhaP-type Na+/H+ or K+/H+ antiporter
MSDLWFQFSDWGTAMLYDGVLIPVETIGGPLFAWVLIISAALFVVRRGWVWVVRMLDSDQHESSHTYPEKKELPRESRRRAYAEDKAWDREFGRDKF